MIDSIAYVVASYRTAATLPTLVDRIAETAPTFAHRHQVVVVDDACPDRSGEAIAGRAGVRAFRLDTNRGQRTAVLAGLTIVDAEVVCVLDADLQDDPGTVPGLVAHLVTSGVGVVCAGRRGDHEGRARRAQAWGFRTARWLATGRAVPRDAGLFHVARADAVRAMIAGAEPGDDPLVAYARTGSALASIPVVRHRRTEGRSAYTTAGRLRMAAATAATIRRRAPRTASWPILHEIHHPELR